RPSDAEDQASPRTSEGMMEGNPMPPGHKLQNRIVSCALTVGVFSDSLWVNDPDLDKVHSRMEQLKETLSSEVTIVTAYFNIGNLNKGGVFNKYTPDRYKRWMSVFGRIDNPLIVFADSEEVIKLFQILRGHFPPERTKTFLIDRDKLWAFQLAPEIKAVFSQPGYPQSDPNTVYENYSCVMHAKFELVHKVIREELFHTKYVAWLDIGLFRGVVHEKHLFPLRLPPNFDRDKVAYSGQARFDPSLTPFQIIAEDRVWVGGAMFLGRPEVVYVYTQDYMRAVRKLLDMKLMSTDQQVIYIMYQPSFDFQPRVELQVYTTNSQDDWFYLGYLLKDAWDISLRRAQPVAQSLQVSGTEPTEGFRHRVNRRFQAQSQQVSGTEPTEGFRHRVNRRFQAQSQQRVSGTESSDCFRHRVNRIFQAQSQQVSGAEPTDCFRHRANRGFQAQSQQRVSDAEPAEGFRRRAGRRFQAQSQQIVSGTEPTEGFRRRANRRFQAQSQQRVSCAEPAEGFRRRASRGFQAQSQQIVSGTESTESFRRRANRGFQAQSQQIVSGTEPAEGFRRRASRGFQAQSQQRVSGTEPAEGFRHRASRGFQAQSQQRVSGTEPTEGFRRRANKG
ncbi:hypothetical protein BaRGS_00000347, partial [Batillaria attramentaria]